jgi:hypothetical protein
MPCISRSSGRLGKSESQYAKHERILITQESSRQRRKPLVGQHGGLKHYVMRMAEAEKPTPTMVLLA